jgi:alpha-2-macroglobulin
VRPRTVAGSVRRPLSLRVFLLAGAAWGLGVAGMSAGDEPATAPKATASAKAGHRAIEPAAPVLPPEVVAAMQEGRFAAAETALGKLSAAEKDPAARGYLALVQGVAQRLGGKGEAARATLRAALDAAPKGPWAAKLRLELAGVELAAGHVADAEVLARAEAEILLAGDRKDRLAEVYHAFARRLLKPDDPVTPADPKAAYDLLAQARNLAKGDDLRARLLVAMARAAKQGNDHVKAINDFQAYLKEYPKGADRLEARYELGVSQRAAGQVLPARLTWTDLARDLEDPKSRPTKEIDEVRAKALFAIPLTYGIPGPPEDTSLNLGVAALRRFLAAYPAHTKAVTAAFQIGVASLNRGKSEEALEAFSRFLKEEGFRVETDEAKRDYASLAMTATFRVGLVLQGQKKFDEAIAAWKGYLAKYPNGPQSADAQRAILDTQLLIAAEHLLGEHYAEARTAWQTFITQNPLDARVPGVLYQVGESFQTEKQFNRAIAAWEPLLSKFPASEPAAHAQFDIAAIYETEKGDPETAIERFKKVAVEPWRAQARQRISVMESRALTVVTPRAFRSGETPHLVVTTRNLEKLTFSAYKLNAEAYFRKKHALQNVESLDIGLVAPDAEWTASVPGYARYKPVETNYDLAKIQVPGVYVVKVTDEKHLQATTLVVGSDLDAVVKTSRDQILVFAQDMKTGKGRPGARVLVAQGDEVILEAKTGADGVLLKTWEKPRGAPSMPRDPLAPTRASTTAPEDRGAPSRPQVPPPPPCGPADEPPAVNAAQAVAVQQPEPQGDASPLAVGSGLTYLVIDGPHVAGSGLGVPNMVAQGLSPRAYIYTDRPAYRPGQQVSLRGIVREVADSQYANVPKAVYKLEVTDSRGRQIVSRPVTLSEFGTFHEQLPLDGAAPVGSYKVRLYQPGKSDFAGAFEVQSYQLQKIDLAFDLKKTVFFRGQTVEGDLVARYQYGAPASGRPIAVRMPDGRIVRGATDAAGKFHITFSTEGFAEEQLLRLAAQLTQDNVSAAANVVLAIRAFSISVSTTRDVYLDGESFQVRATTLDAQGEPTGQSLSAALVKVVTQAGRTTEREVARKTIVTDPKTGRGSVALKATDEQGGSYIVRLAGTDRFGNAVVADRGLTISGKKDETSLRLLADRQTYKVGEEASVNLHSRGRAGTAILAWEADRILSYRIVTLKEGDNALGWVVDGKQFPNFTLTASRMAGKEFDEARLDVRVERDLNVTIKPTKPVVGPGDSTEFEVTTVDQLGHPVSAEVSVALVDRSLLSQFNDKLPPIGPFFYDQTRTGAFASASTNTFTYTPETTPVAEAVVEEAEREVAVAANLGERGRVMEQAKSQVQMNIPLTQSSAPAPTEAAPIAGMMGGQPGRAGGASGLVGGGVAQGLNDREGTVLHAPVVSSDQFGFQYQVQDQTIDADKAGDAREFFENGKGKALGAGTKREFRDSKNAPYQLGLAFARPQARPRERFVETAYWNPGVVTGKDGKARITFKAPMALSEYRFTARGVTGSDTLVGQTNADLTVRKDFFVDLKAPAALTEGDRPRFAAQVHHVGVSGSVALKLTVYAGGRDHVYPKTIDIKDDGVDEVLFDPFDVPAAENVRLTLTASVGASKDELVLEVPVRPWGVQAFASASGTSSDDATVFVGLPGGRAYDNPEMLVVISPTLQRLLIELAVGRDFYPLSDRLNTCIFPPTPGTTVDRASDLLAATSVLQYLRTTRGASAAPEASRLTDHIRSLVSELTAAMNEDGGWPWVGGTGTGPQRQALPSDRMTSAQVVWALSSAEPLGLLTDRNALEKSVAYLTQEYGKVGAGDHETRAMILHALATRGKASFETANSLNRIRQSLSDSALAYLVLTFAVLDRTPLAGEILDILGPRARTEVGEPGGRPRKYWGGAGASPWSRSTTEATALVALAYARVRPRANELVGATDWLLAHRNGFGWNPHKAKGAALAALAEYHGRARGAEDRYNLVVTVNDAEVYRTQVLGAAEGKAVLVPRKALKVGDKNRVRFHVEGRGTFGYAVTLTGFTRDFTPDQNRANRTAVIDRRVYFPAEPEFDGKALPTGFGVAVNPTTFENHVRQVALGGRARVSLNAYRVQPQNQPEWERDFLIVEEHLPAGVTLIEGSVRTSASSYTLADGVLTAYFAPNQYPGGIVYDVYGYLPGKYRALPASIRSAYDPGRSHLGPAGDLQVLSPGEASTDPYKATPDELYARGKALFDAGKLADASAPLEELFNAYTLQDNIAKDAARMLLLINIKEYSPRKVVQYFEVVKEKAPELVITFDDLLVIGRAYRDINEYERAYLVWRGVAEASYVEDARVGEVLRQRGKTLEGIAYLLDLWREYPDSASIESDFFALSQVLARHADKAVTDAKLRRELAEANATRSELLLQSIRLIQAFIALSPKNPLADEASLALVGTFLELEDYAAVVKLSARFAKLYPKSTFLDSFQYSEALGEFHLGHYDRAVEVAKTIASAVYKDAAGADQPSPNKWQALYILGQIFDARQRPAEAITYYRQVAERFSDAADAVKSFTRKDLKLPEVTVVLPPDRRKVAESPRRKAVDLYRLVRDVGAAGNENAPDPRFPDVLKLGYRNIADVDVKVYPVDLMRLYLTRRNLDEIAGIDLAGITPLVEKTIKLGSGDDYADQLKKLDLGLTKEGAYLVMVRGENLYASGILLVSPLELEVLEEPTGGRVRVTVRDAASGALVPKVQVKVIGSANPTFISGETDLRGVFVAEGIHGQAAAVARKGVAQYAFYRGTTALAVPPPSATPPPPNAPAKEEAKPSQTLEENIRNLNGTNQLRNIDRLEKRYQMPAQGQGGAAAGGFR